MHFNRYIMRNFKCPLQFKVAPFKLYRETQSPFRFKIVSFDSFVAPLKWLYAHCAQ